MDVFRGAVTKSLPSLQSWEIPKITYVKAVSEKNDMRKAFLAWESLAILDYMEEDQG